MDEWIDNIINEQTNEQIKSFLTSIIPKKKNRKIRSEEEMLRLYIKYSEEATLYYLLNKDLIFSIVRRYFKNAANVDSLLYKELLHDVIIYRICCCIEKDVQGKIKKSFDGLIRSAIHNGLKNYIKLRNNYYKKFETITPFEGDNSTGSNNDTIEGGLPDEGVPTPFLIKNNDSYDTRSSILEIVKSNFNDFENGCFEFFYLKNYSDREISKIFNCSTSPVVKARLKVFKFLKEYLVYLEEIGEW